MKKIFTLFCTVAILTGFSRVNAQSFTMGSDTLYYTVSGTSIITVNNTVLPATGPVTLNWNIVATNFPADWITASGLCDNQLCYNVGLPTNLWPSGVVKTSFAYPVTGNHDYHLQFNQAAATTNGTYYMRVKLVNPSAPDSVYATWILTKAAVGVEQVNKSSEELSLYPNPANSEINIVYSGSADVKTVSIYNIIGKLMSVYRINGNSANMSLENMPGGIYFVRLADAQGQILATRKFTKQ